MSHVWDKTVEGSQTQCCKKYLISTVLWPFITFQISSFSVNLQQYRNIFLNLLRIRLSTKWMCFWDYELNKPHTSVWLPRLPCQSPQAANQLSELSRLKISWSIWKHLQNVYSLWKYPCSAALINTFFR